MLAVISARRAPPRVVAPMTAVCAAAHGTSTPVTRMGGASRVGRDRPRHHHRCDTCRPHPDYHHGRLKMIAADQSGDLVDESFVVAVAVGEGRDEPQIEVLDRQPATGPECPDQFAQYGVPVGEVHEYQPGVDEVESGVWQWVDDDVVADAFHIGQLYREPAQVDVGRDDVSGGSDPFGQPRGDRPTTGADLQAAPAGGHSVARSGVPRCRVRTGAWPSKTPLTRFSVKRHHHQCRGRCGGYPAISTSAEM